MTFEEYITRLMEIYMQMTTKRFCLEHIKCYNYCKPFGEGVIAMGKEYIHRLKTGREVARLKATRLVTGRYGIDVKRLNHDDWNVNISLPLFETKEDAEIYLSEHYEEA
mgnify:CR=1 FL=1